MTEHRECQRIREACERRFGAPDVVVRSPGRINLIGEHTDTALGVVVPGAIDRAIWLALRASDDGRYRFHAADLDESFDTTATAPAHPGGGWRTYLAGVLLEMAEDGRTPAGVDCVFGGDLPIGSGLSSSAALTCGIAFGLNELFALGYDRLGLAHLGQTVEHRYAAVQCGLMDQFASLLGRAGHVIRLDCRDLHHAYIPFAPTGLVIVLCDSYVRRSLAADGVYNQRRAQCDAGLTGLNVQHPGLESLRDVSLEVLEAARATIDPVVFARCAYVVQENQRALAACAALARGDLVRVGQAMNESHRGLKEDFEVSCPELDVLAEAAQRLAGVVGSRMMGAGFGGCTINLVREDALPPFEDHMARVYRQALHREPLLHVCRLTDGTEIVHRVHRRV